MGKSKYTKELLTEKVKEVSNLSELVRLLTDSNKAHGSMIAYIKSKLISYDIDFSHFNGKKWCEGRVNPTGIAITEDEFKTNYLTKNPIKRTGSTSIKKWLNKFNLLGYKCQCCGNEGEWMGKSMTLQLDHINGVNDDNRLENLRFLCPNCHSQTETYTGRNIKK